MGQPLPTDAEVDRLVAAALAVFAEKGFEATRLSDIARRAGASPSTLLRHFRSKDEIFRDVVRSTLLGEGRATPLDTRPGDRLGDVTAADEVRDFARRYWRAMERPELVAVLRLVVGELPRFPELAAFHAAEALERLVRALERIIERGVARGELRPVDVRAAARSILATLAAHALWFAYPRIYAGLTGADRERAAAATIETLVAAFTAHPAPNAPSEPSE